MLRRASRAVAVTSGLGAALLAAPAQAAPPITWPTPENDSLLASLVYLVGVPLLVIALVTLLVYLPSMIRGQSSEPALAFQERPEWFGGPRKGAAATAESVPEDGSKGGASARW